MPYIGTSPSQGVRRVHTYTATANQTSFSGAGAEGATLSYKDSNFVDVYQNGVKLGDADYTATSGTAIVLGTGATVSDLVVIVAYDVFSAADTVSKADGGQFDGNVTMAGTLAVTGTTALTGNATMAGTLGVTGETTLATHLNMGDGDIIKLGASADLTLQHDGSNSYIKDEGTGNLYIRTDGTTMNLQAGSDNAVKITKDAQVELYHDNSKKFETTSSGIDVTGTIEADDKVTIAYESGSSDWELESTSGDDFTISRNGSQKLLIDGSTSNTTLANGLTLTDGNLVVASGHGIDFSAAGNVGGMDSELLDDYEEGTWTPTVNTGTGYSAQFGRYVKIGKMVFINANVNTSATSSAGNIIQGLPFASSNTGNSAGNLSIGYYATVNVAVVWMSGYVLNSSHNIYIVGNSAGHTGSTIQHNGGSFFSGNSRIMFSGVYESA
jgi:hypothetical protein